MTKVAGSKTKEGLFSLERGHPLENPPVRGKSGAFVTQMDCRPGFSVRRNYLAADLGAPLRFSMTKIKIVLVALAALANNVSFAGGPSNPCFDMDEVACQTFSLTNVERVKAGLPSLNYSPACFAMAQEQSADMADRHYFDHHRPASAGRPAEDFSHRAARFGLSKGMGENIAMARSPERAMVLWMNSAGHRRNILNPRFRNLGVGFKDDLYTQSFGN